MRQTPPNKSILIPGYKATIMTLGEAQMQTQEADGWSSRCLINPKGIGKRMVMDRQKVITRSESRRYRVAGWLEVRAGRKVRQAGTESRTSNGQNPKD